MARYDFGGTLADFVVSARRLGGIDVLGLASATLTLWSAQTGGTRYTDLVLNGSSVASITVGTDGQVPKFQGPDGVTEMWVDGGSPRIRIVTLQGAQGPQGLPGVNAVANDAATAAQITTAGTATQNAADARYARHDQRVVVTAPTRTAFIAALDAAKLKGPGTIVYAPDYGTPYDLGNGVSLSGYSCQIQGAGAAGTLTNPTGTVFTATTQTGPVLDYTGWVIPSPAFVGRTRHGGFHVKGSGAADATKVRSGIKFATMSSATFHDIAISNTGGPCIEGASTPGNSLYLCDFERITLNTPISAKANDVAYMRIDEPNGCQFKSIGLRSLSASADVGVSGAIVVTSNATYPGYDFAFTGTWMENLHVPTGGTLIAIQGNLSVWNDTQFHDCLAEVGATGTSYFRLTAPAVSNYGGNRIMGVIPGTDPGSSTSINVGVDNRQSRNLFEGVKGYKGANVMHASGVTDNHVRLGGAHSGASNPAVIDNSGNTTNTLEDAYLKVFPAPVPVVPAVRKFISGRYYGAANHGTPGTAANGANYQTMIPLWVSSSFTVAAIACEVTTAATGATVRLGIYNSNSNDTPNTPILDAGTVDASTTGAKEITGLSLVLAPGLYWLACVPLGGNPTLRTIGTSALAPVAPDTFLGSNGTVGANAYFNPASSGLGVWSSTSTTGGGFKVMVKAT